MGGAGKDRRWEGRKWTAVRRGDRPASLQVSGQAPPGDPTTLSGLTPYCSKATVCVLPCPPPLHALPFLSSPSCLCSFLLCSQVRSYRPNSKATFCSRLGFPCSPQKCGSFHTALLHSQGQRLQKAPLGRGVQAERREDGEGPGSPGGRVQE